MEFLFLLIIPLIIIGIIFGAQAAKKRREEFNLFATEHNLSFNSDKSRYIDDEYPQFSCLRSGKNRYAYNMLTGTWNAMPIKAFDYHYETESRDKDGKTQTHHHYFSATILRLPYHFKHLFIRPEGFWDKVTEFFGYDDIDFESAEFSRKFYVKAEEKKWAYDVLHTRTMQYLLDQPKYTIEFNGYDVLIYTGSVFKIPQFAESANIVCGILDALPEYVQRELKDQQDPTHPANT